MKRKSLSASLGSWYVQLAYNPHRTEEDSRPAERAIKPQTTPQQKATSHPWLLLMPAFAALALGAGAGCYALAHFVTFGAWATYLVGALLGAIGVSVGACCGAPWMRRLCQGARWPLVLLILFVAASARFNSILPSEAEGESNTLVALLVGLITILSVLLVGVRSGARTVPLSAPLVPCLSLFGLLCLISVDTTIQICFVIFVAAALYLLSYDRFLRLYAPELAAGIAFATPSISSVRPPSHKECWLWASQSLLVSGIWFVLFMIGGAVFYLPVQAILPGLISPQLNKMRAAAQGLLLDYRGSAAVMELRGGDYTLSDREIMRITVNRGEASGLWRGRVYEYYDGSRWEEDGGMAFSPWGGYPPTREFRHNGRRFGERYPGAPGEASLRYRLLEGDSAFSQSRYSLEAPRRANRKPRIDPKLAQVEEILEYVEPLEIGPSVIFSSGYPISWQDRPDTDSENWSYSDYSLDSGGASHESLRPRAPYLVRSYVVRPRLVSLQHAPGYEKGASRKGTIGSRFASYHMERNLQLPTDPATRRLLKGIAYQITLSQKRKPRTPYDKVRMINSYLTQNCLYSLRSPSVPVTKDAVTFFLTDSRQGACDMFASSMVLLLRTMDVPARVVTGYLQPELPMNSANSTTEVSQRSTWLVRERDAHAWVEYYVPGMGWLTYDPTSGTRSVETSTYNIGRILNLPKLDLPRPTLVLPVAGLLLLVLGVSWPRLEKRFRGSQEFDSEATARLRIVQAYCRAQHRMRRRVPLEAHLTPQEYEARVCHARLPLAVKQEFAALTHLYIAARYGTVPAVSASDLDLCVSRLHRAMSGKKA